MENNLFDGKESLSVETIPVQENGDVKPSGKRRGKKKIKDDCCGLSELQLKEALKAVIYADSLKPGADVSMLQIPLSIASKPGKDVFFTDFDSRPYIYSTATKEKTYNNSGVEKYLIPAGAAYVSVLNNYAAIAITEIRFESKDISLLSALLHLNKTFDIPLVILLHTNHQLKDIADSFNADYYSLPGTMITEDYEVLKTAVENSRNNKNISIVIVSPHNGESYSADNEKFLLSKKIINKEELNTLKQQPQSDILDIDLNISLENEMPENNNIQLSNINYEQDKTFLELPDFELMCFAAGLSLCGFKVNVSLSENTFIQAFRQVISNFLYKNNLHDFPALTIHADKQEDKEHTTAGDFTPPPEEESREDIQYETKHEFNEPETPSTTFQEPVTEHSITEIISQGEDITVIIFDNEDSISEKISAELKNSDVGADVIKVTGNHYDASIIIQSIENTAKALVVTGGEKRKSSASELIAEISEKSFQSLDAPPMRVMYQQDDSLVEIIAACSRLSAF